MADSSSSRGPARETRLLLLTLLVSVAVLFLLARFRFPERPITDLSPPQPLTRLGRPLAFDELSGTLADLLRRFDASIVVLRVSGGGGDGGDVSRLVPALRVRDDVALVTLAPGEHVTGGGTGEGTATPQMAALDELRGLAAVRVPARTATPVAASPQNELVEVPGYVAVVEASPGGPIIRAEFVSTVARADRPGWDVPAALIGGLRHARPGALLFSLGGRFIGTVLADADGAAVVAPGEALMARADRLASGESIRLARPGFTVQPLSRALGKASGATAGVMVNGIVSPAAEAADVSTLELGDVITAASGEPVRSIDDWQRLLARHAAGALLPLDVMRFGKPLRLTIALAAAGAAADTRSVSPTAGSAAGSAAAAAAAVGATRGPGAAAASAGAPTPPAPRLGASFRAAAGGTLEIVSVDPAGPAALAGLQPGDRITALLPARGALTSARPAAAFAALKPGDALVLALDRRNARHVVAVEKR